MTYIQIIFNTKNHRVHLEKLTIDFANLVYSKSLRNLQFCLYNEIKPEDT